MNISNRICAYRNEGTGNPCAGQAIAIADDFDSKNEFVFDAFGILGVELPTGS